MTEITFTLLTDGSSYRALIPILTWLLQEYLTDYAIQPQWADLRRLDKSLRDSFQKRIQKSIELYPCDLLFIHRDAEKEDYKTRFDEIQRAITQARSFVTMPAVCVIPIRMTEAWLLFEITAIRSAASNPKGKIALQLPDIKRIEEHPDPKMLLYDLLKQAADLNQRRMQRFYPSDCVQIVAERIRDFSPLRTLTAFQALETELLAVMKSQGWVAR
jgi:Domain of unknown function (DUF4276)